MIPESKQLFTVHGGSRFSLAACVVITLLVCSSFALAQHEHHGMAMKQSTDAKLEVRQAEQAVVSDGGGKPVVSHLLIVRVGPLHLAAHATHMDVAQAPSMFVEIPFDGWITAYHPKLVDEDELAVPGRLLHHVAFYNTARADFVCPNKLEHIFGAGGEMNDWPAVPGVGYRVHPGDRIRVDTMFHNPTGTDYNQTFMEVQMEYKRTTDAGVAAIKSVYPAWFDVQECGHSGYDLPAGRSEKSGNIKLEHSGVLLGVGGHMHDYGRELDFWNVTKKESIAKLPAKLDDNGKIISMPVTYFSDRGGYRLNKGDELKVVSTYDNPTQKSIEDGAMGIVVGYFVPSDDAEMAGLKK